MMNSDELLAALALADDTDALVALRRAPPLSRSVALSSGLRIGYHESAGGEGRPIVLVHPVHAAAGSHDVLPLFECLARAGRRVYALDLPGFGRSDRGERVYDDAQYTSALTCFLSDVVYADRCGGASVVAMNLSCEFAARVAIESPSLVRCLVLLSPTGLSDERRPSRALAKLRLAALSLPAIARPLFALLTSRVSLRFQLARSLSVPVPPELMDALERTVRADGAERAALAFLSGLPFHPRPFEELYRALTKPTMVVYDRDPRTTFERLPELVRANAWVRPIQLAPSGGLSTYEQPATLAALVVEQQFDVEAFPPATAASARTSARRSQAA